MKKRYIAPHSSMMLFSPESHLLSISGEEKVNYRNTYSENAATQQFSNRRGNSTLWADMEE
ncbi:MAG: hypothetical protein SPE13_05110 [Alloprevotella sp.]|nr:hypothetical protein [Bacteroidales bacterium]MDY4564793.1 hypothetical protein [Alloprevotella sp.]MDY4619681.1 hypothetical protein [Alloprevotella sp.]